MRLVSSAGGLMTWYNLNIEARIDYILTRCIRYLQAKKTNSLFGIWVQKQPDVINHLISILKGTPCASLLKPLLRGLHRLTQGRCTALADSSRKNLTRTIFNMLGRQYIYR